MKVFFLMALILGHTIPLKNPTKRAENTLTINQ